MNSFKGGAILKLYERIAELRRKNKLTQKQVAEYLKVAKSTYSQYETGKSSPDYETLKKIAKLYNVSLDELLNHEIISENEDEFYYHRLKSLTKQELGDKGVLFYDKHKMKKEELNILLAVFNAIKNK